MKTVAVIGASRDRSKFGNKAVRAFLANDYEVYPVNPREAEIEGYTCFPEIAAVSVGLDIVSVYLPPPVLLELLPEIERKGCGQLWLNPGTADAEVIAAVERMGLEYRELCSIVALGMSPAEL